MPQVDERKLLRKASVVNEIERYRWIESEKCGYDIEFRKAADEWIVFYALAWLKYHTPSTKQLRLTPFVRRSLQLKRVRN